MMKNCFPNHSRFPPEEFVSFDGLGCLKNVHSFEKRFYFLKNLIQENPFLGYSYGGYGSYKPQYGGGYETQYGSGK